MKKSLIALSVLTALSAGSYAQSSVTLYGKVDLGLVVDSGAPAGKSVRIAAVTGGSRLGFKGVEDLGGGYKAAFQLETGLCADSAAGAPNFCTGNNQFMGRQAYGALSGSFGSVSAGRQYSLGYTTLAIVDPFGTGYAGQANNSDGKGTYVVDNSAARLNNSFTYTTPSFSGLTASAEMALGEQVGNWQGGRETGASINYAQGPAYGAVTFYDLDNANGSGSARKVLTGAGTYNFGIVKIHAILQKVSGDPTGAMSIDMLNALGGITLPLGGGSVLGSYIRHNDRSSANQDTSQLGLGYTYPLSKRTSLYTAWARNWNKNGAAFLIGNASETGTGNKAFNLGAVHNF
jgi:predicted porin